MSSRRIITVGGGREGDDDHDMTAPTLAPLGVAVDHHTVDGDPDEVARHVLDDLLRTRDRIQIMLEHAVAGRWYASDWRGHTEMRDLSGWKPPADVVEDASIALVGGVVERVHRDYYCDCRWLMRDGRRQRKVSGCDRHPMKLGAGDG